MNLIAYIRRLFNTDPPPEPQQPPEPEKKGRMELERLELIEQMKVLYRFLETDLGYVYSVEKEIDGNPGGPHYYINRYTNLIAQRQLQIVVHRNSEPIYFYLKRLQDNREPSYKDNENCYTLANIDMLNGIDDYKRHSSYSQPDGALGSLKIGLEILQTIPDILAGRDWPDRAETDNIYLAKRGYTSGWRPNHTVTMIKKVFSFLATDLQLTIIKDYDDLRPFEQGLGGYLVYRNAKITVMFSIDFRDQDFIIYLGDTNKYEPDDYLYAAPKVYMGKTTEADMEAAATLLKAKIKERFGWGYPL